ncbi:MAG: hypothetical protein M5T52_10725 [Ignavibacteriaceae bacterium]|nr:hypothetical protein [Ignavibacteriaceae bacterium]
MKKSLFRINNISFLFVLIQILFSGNIMAQEKQLAWDLYHSHENFNEKV